MTTAVSLAPWQVGVLALIATLLTSLLSWIVEKGIPWLARLLKKDIEIDLGRLVKTTMLVIVAAVLAYRWFPFAVPAFPYFKGVEFPVQWAMFWQWAGTAWVAISPYIGTAAAIYNSILTFVLDPEKRVQPIKDLLAWLQTQFLPGSAKKK